MDKKLANRRLDDVEMAKTSHTTGIERTGEPLSYADSVSK